MTLKDSTFTQQTTAMTPTELHAMIVCMDHQLARIFCMHPCAAEALRFADPH
jgi:hypothetical protein